MLAYCVVAPVHPRVCGEQQHRDGRRGTEGSSRRVHPRVCGELVEGAEAGCQVRSMLTGAVRRKQPCVSRSVSGPTSPVHPRCGEQVSSDNYSCRWRQLELPVVLRKLEGGRGSPKGDQCSPRIVAEGGGSRGKRSLPLSGRARQSAVREGPGGEPPGPEFGAVGRLLFWRSCDRHSGESARAVEPPRLEALLEALHGYLFSLASPWRRRACSAR